MRTKSIAIVFLSLVLLVSLQHASAQKTWETFGRANGMVGDEVISMDYSGGELWVATTYIEPDVEEASLEGGVSLLDPSTGNFTTYTPNEGLAHVKVWDILIDGDRVWFGTPRGLSMLDKQKLKTLEPYEIQQAWTTFTSKDGLLSDDVRCMAKEGDILWLGTNLGVSGYNTKTGEWTNITTKDGLPARGVQSLAVQNGVLWIGTTNGLALYDTKSRSMKTFEPPGEGLDAKIVNVLAVGPEKVWIGTRMGLFTLDPETGDWTQYGKDSLPDTWIQTIAFRDDEVWVGTRKGLGIYNKQKEKWKILDEKKGLASNDVRAIAPVDDYTWIGTSKGLNKYYPGAAAARIRKIVPIVAVVVIAAAGGIAVLAKLLKPSPEELERRRKAEEIRAKRKERRRTEKPPWEICNGVPKPELCGRCRYSSVKAGKLHCTKYDIDLE